MLPTFLAIVLCRLIVIPIGRNPIHAVVFPSGICTFCCPIDTDRDIEYQLYTRRNPGIPDVLRVGDVGTLSKSHFNVKHPTVFYIHGYGEGAPGLSAGTVRDAYLKRSNYNVILVNWAKLAAMPFYVTAVGNAKLVGKDLSRMMKFLNDERLVAMSRIHVVGFSLGAEIAGFMGKALSPDKVGRITGLDAAYPLYMNTGKDGHLTSADAQFVDVVHTDGGLLGFPNPLGHADFYPNGGKPPQPGCNLYNAFAAGLVRLVGQYIACSHHRAWHYYAESVRNPLGFPASRCERWHPEVGVNCRWTSDAYMGIAASPRIRGKFYLRTSDRPPYARNSTGYF